VAVGDTYSVGLTQETNNSSLTIQPAGTVEAVVHNIYVPAGSAWELYRTDGTNPIKIDSDAVTGRYNLQIHVTNTQYLTLKNVSGSTIYMAVDGMITHA
jgi:hypothetical protein